MDSRLLWTRQARVGRSEAGNTGVTISPYLVSYVSPSSGARDEGERINVSIFVGVAIGTLFMADLAAAQSVSLTLGEAVRSL